MTTFDKWKTNAPEEMENQCYYCGNPCKETYCTSACKVADYLENCKE